MVETYRPNFVVAAEYYATRGSETSELATLLKPEGDFPDFAQNVSGIWVPHEISEDHERFDKLNLLANTVSQQRVDEGEEPLRLYCDLSCSGSVKDVIKYLGRFYRRTFAPHVTVTFAPKVEPELIKAVLEDHAVLEGKWVHDFMLSGVLPEDNPNPGEFNMKRSPKKEINRTRKRSKLVAQFEEKGYPGLVGLCGLGSLALHTLHDQPYLAMGVDDGEGYVVKLGEDDLVFKRGSTLAETLPQATMTDLLFGRALFKDATGEHTSFDMVDKSGRPEDLKRIYETVVANIKDRRQRVAEYIASREEFVIA